MSEHEFEKFLAIFRGLLRLNPAQRDEIAAELMDHLQERLSDLSDRGMSHEQAVQAALEEFGDAAGLAAQFLLVLSQQRRRRIMKWTASSIAAAMVVLWGAYAFWPATPVRGPAPAQLVAQQTPGARGKSKGTAEAKKDSTGQAPGAAKTDSTKEIESRLAQKTAANFVETPLQDVLDHISGQTTVDFYVDKKGLADTGTGLDMPVNVTLKSIRNDRLLDLVLGEVGLLWVVRDDYVFVTTKEKLQETLETRVYNCRDLIGMAPIGMSEGGMSGFGSSFGSLDGSGAMGSAGAGSSSMGMGMPGMGTGMGISGMGGMGMGSMSGMQGAPGTGMEAMGMGGPPGMAGGESGMMSSGMHPGGMGMSSTTPYQYMTTLIQVVTMTVMPESWTTSGGPGSVSAYHGGLLVVNHHAQAHQKIEQLLRMLREASKDRPGAIVRER
jgi:hypothetical protein